MQSNKGSGFQRSRRGCLTCRRKRKKCDEKSPVCSRCEKGDSECIWPQHSADPAPSTLDVFLGEQIAAGLEFSTPAGFGATSISESSFGPSYFIAQTGLHLPIEIIPPATDTRFEDLIARDSDSGSTLSPRSDHDQTGFLRGVSAPNTSTSSETHSLLASTHSKHLLKNWEYAQDYGPRIIWPPNDLEEVHDFDPEEVMPTLYKSIDSLTRTAAIEPVFNEILHFWSTFLSRVFYDYTIFPESIAGWMLQRFKMSDSAKYGMLATAVLFRANYERSPSTNFLRDHARELHSLASRQISLDLKNNEMSPQVKLAGLIEVTNYEYYSSTLTRYYPHVLEAASIVRQIIGGDTLDLLSLSGMHTFDVRCFAWCDILHSMATSRPTMLKYESNIKQAQQSGYEDGYSNPDKGVEWIYGCPNVLTVLMAQITTLKHSPTSKEEIVRQGAILEESILNWEFQPTRAKGSVMRVARVGVQEVWRHVATLYLHQAVFRSNPTHPTVRNSVRNIVRIASTLKPGINPDCFLPVPYFIAGSFALSQNDRFILRSRVLSCGNEPYLRNLASNLEDIWTENDSTGRFASWSDKEPPTIVF